MPVSDQLCHVSGPRRTGELSKTHATGCALMKGEQDPVLKPGDKRELTFGQAMPWVRHVRYVCAILCSPDEEYPPWLWKLLEPEPSAKDLVSRYQGSGLSMAQVTVAPMHLRHM